VGAASGNQPVTLSNTGQLNLFLNQVSVSPSVFTMSGPTPPVTIIPGSSVTYNVAFGPSAPQGYAGSLTFTSNAYNGTVATSLSGTGVTATTVLNVSPATLPFGSQVVNVTTPSQTVTVTNGGITSITINSVQATAPFTVTGFAGTTTLNSGQSLSLAVTFTPTAQTGYTGTLTITSTAPSSPNTVSLSGTGVTQTAGTPLCGIADNGSAIYLPGLSTPNPTIPGISDYIPFVPPAKMGTYVDPAFGCTVTRLTDGEANFSAPTGHNYVRSAWNADSTKFTLENLSSGGFGVVDVAAGNILVAFGQFDSHFSGSNADETWDRTNPNIIYYENGNTLNKADISACTLASPCDGAHGTSVVYTRMHTFTEYSSLDSNNNKKDISLDGCFYPMGGTSGSNFDAFAYNLCTNTKGPTFTCTTSQADHFTSGMVHSNRMWVGWGSATGTSQCVGEWLYDTSMSPVQQLFTNAPHSTGVYDPVANKEYILYSGGLNHHVCNGGGSSEIATVDLQNFTYTCLVPVPFSVGNIHETSNNPNGWWGYEITDSGNTANDNSTLAANWQNSWGHSYNEIGIGNISTGKIYRLAHSRTRTGGASPCGGYFTQTRPSMSLDGTHIAFDSSMARTNSPLPACIQNYDDVYTIKFR
jgi:hypothetical protein